MSSGELKIFSGTANFPLFEKICNYLGHPQGQMTVEKFPDGETFCRIEEDVRGKDVFIIQPTCRPVNDTMMELLIMIDAVRRASAAHITAVVPYFGYARQDRKDEGRVPITAKLAANLLESAGATRVMALDLHSAQIQGFFDVPFDHLSASPVIDDYINSLGYDPEEVVVVSPDAGSIKRATKHVAALGGTLAIIDKRRKSGSEVEQAHLIGDRIEGRIALIFDDMISTGGSITGAAHVVKEMGAKKVYVAATHGILCGPAIERLQNAPIEEVVLSDTIPLLPEHNIPKIKVLSCAPIVAEAIKRIHSNQSISEMFKTLNFNFGQYF
ncbi:MAG: ribose-phosphate pyrophosphokinase [Thermoguttaceae bacterium]|jgi:ribose-phosphate pyrophosphokinase|nr:ribose-phosphate pyrophosphokinase [Thermoguttaceae bacterium]